MSAAQLLSPDKAFVVLSLDLTFSTQPSGRLLFGIAYVLSWLPRGSRDTLEPFVNVAFFSHSNWGSSSALSGSGYLEVCFIPVGIPGPRSWSQTWGQQLPPCVSVPEARAHVLACLPPSFSPSLSFLPSFSLFLCTYVPMCVCTRSHKHTHRYILGSTILRTPGSSPLWRGNQGRNLKQLVTSQCSEQQRETNVQVSVFS